MRQAGEIIPPPLATSYSSTVFHRPFRECARRDNVLYHRAMLVAVLIPLFELWKVGEVKMTVCGLYSGSRGG
jgi:hypothetical protein